MWEEEEEEASPLLAVVRRRVLTGEGDGEREEVMSTSSESSDSSSGASEAGVSGGSSEVNESPGETGGEGLIGEFLAGVTAERGRVGGPTPVAAAWAAGVEAGAFGIEGIAEVEATVWAV